MTRIYAVNSDKEKLFILTNNVCFVATMAMEAGWYMWTIRRVGKNAGDYSDAFHARSNNRKLAVQEVIRQCELRNEVGDGVDALKTRDSFAEAGVIGKEEKISDWS